MKGSTLRKVEFKNCKLLGLRFDECNPFLLSFSFEECLLSYASFFKLKMRETRFESCKLVEVDFSEADLFKTSFNNCDLSGAIFSSTNLQKADLSTAIHFSIDPEINKLREAKFSKNNLSGLLDKYYLDLL